MCVTLGLINEIDCSLDDTVLTLVIGEDSGWFLDSDTSVSSLYLDDDQMFRAHKGENESETEFSDSGKGQVAIQGKIALFALNIDDGDKRLQTIN